MSDDVVMGLPKTRLLVHTSPEWTSVLEVWRHDDGELSIGAAGAGPEHHFVLPGDCEPVLCRVSGAPFGRGIAARFPATETFEGCSVALRGPDGNVCGVAATTREAWVITFSIADLAGGSWLEWTDAAGDVFARRRMDSTPGFAGAGKIWATPPPFR